MPWRARNAGPSLEWAAFGPIPVVTMRYGSIPWLEHVGAHEVDQRRCVRDHAEQTPARLDLHDVDAAFGVTRPRIERLAADDPHVVTARGESGRELKGEALGAAHRGEGAFGEQDPHSMDSTARDLPRGC